jgi:hypothetical protein
MRTYCAYRSSSYLFYATSLSRSWVVGGVELVSLSFSVSVSISPSKPNKAEILSSTPPPLDEGKDTHFFQTK